MDIPSTNTTLTFDYKTDGTFEYEMVGKGNGLLSCVRRQAGKLSGGWKDKDVFKTAVHINISCCVLIALVVQLG